MYSESEKQMKLEEARYMLFEQGCSLHDTARKLGIADRSLKIWLKDAGIQHKINRRRNIAAAQAQTYKTSLPAFIAYVDKRHPGRFPGITDVYHEFVNKH